MKHSVRSHCDGAGVVPERIRDEVSAAISVTAVKPARGAAASVRSAILSNLRAAGWSAQMAVAEGSDISITSVRENVGLCLQTGNMARMYADLIKLQTMYLDGIITSAILILPSVTVAKGLGSNIAQAQRLERELDIFKKAYHVPTLIFSLE